MLETLFGNATAEKVLLSIVNYGEGYTNGIAKIFGMPPSQVEKQLLRLEAGGILVARRVGNMKLYGINPRWSFKREFQALLEKALRELPDDEIKKYYRVRARPRRTGKDLR